MRCERHTTGWTPSRLQKLNPGAKQSSGIEAVLRYANNYEDALELQATTFDFFVRDGDDTVAAGRIISPKFRAALADLPSGEWTVDETGRTVTLAPDGRSLTDAFVDAHETLMRGPFPGLDAGKRNSELRPLYNGAGDVIAGIPRPFMIWTGSLGFGVHYIATFKDKSDGDRLKVWVPRRSWNKHVNPGMLDNTIGGAASCRDSSLRMSVIDSLRDECNEEGSVPQHLADQAVYKGYFTYSHIIYENGLPHVEAGCPFLFFGDFGDFKPEINDGEVDSFNYYPLETVKELLLDGQFTYNSAVCYVIFLRHHEMLSDEECKQMDRLLQTTCRFNLTKECFDPAGESRAYPAKNGDLWA